MRHLHIDAIHFRRLSPLHTNYDDKINLLTFMTKRTSIPQVTHVNIISWSLLILITTINKITGSCKRTIIICISWFFCTKLYLDINCLCEQKRIAHFYKLMTETLFEILIKIKNVHFIFVMCNINQLKEYSDFILAWIVLHTSSEF